MPSSGAETKEGKHVPSPLGETRKCAGLTSSLVVEVCGEAEQEPRDFEARSRLWDPICPLGPLTASNEVCCVFPLFIQLPFTECSLPGPGPPPFLIFRAVS